MIDTPEIKDSEQKSNLYHELFMLIMNDPAIRGLIARAGEDKVLSEGELAAIMQVLANIYGLKDISSQIGLVRWYVEEAFVDLEILTPEELATQRAEREARLKQLEESAEKQNQRELQAKRNKAKARLRSDDDDEKFLVAKRSLQKASNIVSPQRISAAAMGVATFMIAEDVALGSSLTPSQAPAQEDHISRIQAILQQIREEHEKEKDI